MYSESLVKGFLCFPAFLLSGNTRFTFSSFPSQIWKLEIHFDLNEHRDWGREMQVIDWSQLHV